MCREALGEYFVLKLHERSMDEIMQRISLLLDTFGSCVDGRGDMSREERLLDRIELCNQLFGELHDLQGVNLYDVGLFQNETGRVNELGLERIGMALYWDYEEGKFCDSLVRPQGLSMEGLGDE